MRQLFAGRDPDRQGSVTRRLRLDAQSVSIRLHHAVWGIVDQMAEKDGSARCLVRGPVRSGAAPAFDYPFDLAEACRICQPSRTPG